jgi:two-component system alkaline phosphatase synthesis response regulator PhoP
MDCKVLIAEDELHIRLLIEQSLEELEDDGVELLMASDGEEALALAKREHPAVVLLDVMMPKVNGFEVCEQIRADPELAGIHIILLTAKGQEFDRRQGQEAGANAYMTKPFNPDELLSAVRAAIGLGGD